MNLHIDEYHMVFLLQVWNPHECMLEGGGWIEAVLSVDKHAIHSLPVVVL